MWFSRTIVSNGSLAREKGYSKQKVKKKDDQLSHTKGDDNSLTKDQEERWEWYSNTKGNKRS